MMEKEFLMALKTRFPVARYHSLAIEKCPNGFDVRAWAEDKEIMSIEHKTYPLCGIQFHPESFMTEDGKFNYEKLFVPTTMKSAIIKNVSFEDLWDRFAEDENNLCCTRKFGNDGWESFIAWNPLSFIQPVKMMVLRA